MKMTCIAATLSAVAFATCAYGQNADYTTPQQPVTSPGSANGYSPAVESSGGGYVSGGFAAGSASAHSLTRADVRQQLVDAQRDGELAKLNATVYKGGQ